MGYRLNRLDEPIFIAGPKPMRTEFGIHIRLESCATPSVFHADGMVKFFIRALGDLTEDFWL